MKLFELLRRGFRKWWFYPVLATYLLFGIWFGSLNYRVDKDPENYIYKTRFVLFPVVTVLQEGWLCPNSSLDKESCVVKSDRFGMENDPNSPDMSKSFLMSIIRSLSPHRSQAIYTTMMAFGWPFKIALNIFSIIMILVLSALFALYGVAITFIAIVFSAAVLGATQFFGLLAKLFSLLL